MSSDSTGPARARIYTQSKPLRATDRERAGPADTQLSLTGRSTGQRNDGPDMIGGGRAAATCCRGHAFCPSLLGVSCMSASGRAGYRLVDLRGAEAACCVQVVVWLRRAFVAAR